MRKEINTPILMEEKQHLVKCFGKFYSVFSYVKGGRRVFKCRERFANESAATAYWAEMVAQW